MSLRIIIVAAVAVFLSSCSRPLSSEQFVKIGDKGEDGLYHFALDFSDSLCTYDLAFYSRLDCSSSKLSEVRDFPMTVVLISPDGRKYSEKVYFEVHKDRPDEDFYSNQYRIPYRSGLVPVKWGAWEMTVRIDSDRYIPGFRGLGLICEKNISDGTR